MHYKVTGGKTLSGTVVTNISKNAASMRRSGVVALPRTFFLLEFSR